MKTSPRLKRIFTTRDGNTLLGLFGDPAYQLEGNTELARRIFRTACNSVVSTGSVIQRNGIRYLLVHHSSDGVEDRYLAFEITHTVSHKRVMTTTDPVTRMKTNGVPQELDPALPIVVEPYTLQDDLGIERPKYRVRAPGELLPGDTLGDLTVHATRPLVGATVAEAF